MTTFNLPLTEAKAQVLLQLIDLAVKMGGLSVAGNALVMAQDIQTAVQQKAAVPQPSDNGDVQTLQMSALRT